MAPRHVDNGRTPIGSNGLGRVLTEAGLVVVLVLIFHLAARTFLVQTYSVPTGSMENTLQRDDVLVVSVGSHSADTPARGDIVVFRDPGGWLPAAGERRSAAASLARQVMEFVGLLPRSPSGQLVKRVIGLAGDSVVCDDQGSLTVNGVPVAEPYLYPGDRACAAPFQATVPAQSVWAMGDHRSRSADSRYHRAVNDGAVPVENIIGRVVAVVSAGSLHWF